MSSRNFAQVPPTAATIALNAYIYGYGGHSLVTPHQALKRLWWTDERIDARITRAFVISKLRGEEREFLDRPLAFGEGLTDDTYMEWILERAKRLFLILTQIGVPDQIFGCIDDSWDDDDLPIPLDNVKSLELSYDNDEALNKRFYDMQFVYLLRELKKGTHIDYGPKEHIPMEHANTLPPATTLQPYDRVHFPGRPEEIFMRRKYSLTGKETGQFTDEAFTGDICRARALAHEHVASTWATYTSENSAYIISDFVPEHTLATFIEHRTPASYVKISRDERPLVICEWMHCLSDALASLHHRGQAHTAIRPSNIWIDDDNHIALADIGSIPTYQLNKKVPKTELYDYAAPESQLSWSNVVVRTGTSPSSPPISSMNAFSRLRKLSTYSDHSSISGASSSSSSSSAGGSSIRSASFVNLAGTSPVTPPSTSARSSSLSTKSTALSPTLSPRSPRSIRNFSRCLAHPKLASTATGQFSPITSPLLVHGFPSSTLIDSATLRDLPSATPEMSDVYSLGCIYLDLLTFLIRGKTTDFLKFRTTRISHHRHHDSKLANTTASSATATTITLPPSSKSDSSFHAHPDQISTWLNMLSTEVSATAKTSSSADVVDRNSVLTRGVPRLLHLVRSMLAQNATLRPTALGVRETIEQVLEECGIRGETLCCWDRSWELSEDAVDTEIGRARGSGNWSGSFTMQEAQQEKTSRTEVNQKSKKERRTSSAKSKKEKKKSKREKSSRPGSPALSGKGTGSQEMDMSIFQRLEAACSPPLTPTSPMAMSPPPLFSAHRPLSRLVSPKPRLASPPPPFGTPPTSPPSPPPPDLIASIPPKSGSPFRPVLHESTINSSTPTTNLTQPFAPASPASPNLGRRPSFSAPQLPPLSPLSAFPALSVPPATSSMLVPRPATSASLTPPPTSFNPKNGPQSKDIETQPAPSINDSNIPHTALSASQEPAASPTPATYHRHQASPSPHNPPLPPSPSIPPPHTNSTSSVDGNRLAARSLPNAGLPRSEQSTAGVKEGQKREGKGTSPWRMKAWFR